MRWSTLLLVLVLAAPAHAAAGDAWHFQVDAAPVHGTPCHFHLWLPDGVPRVRAAFLFTYYGSYEGWSKERQIRDLARDLECAVIASDQMYINEGEDGTRVLDALRGLSLASGHPEVANLPLFVFGHSNSTYPVGEIVRAIPERIVAWVAMKSAFGAQFESPQAARIPGMVVSGEKDDSYFGDQLTTVKRMRREHRALVHMIVEADGPHWPNGPTFEIQNAFLRHAFYRRVPYDADATLAPVTLIPIEEKDGWLGQNLEGERIQKIDGTNRWWVWDRPTVVKRRLEIARAADYPGESADASWFPSAEYAKMWQEYCETLSAPGWNSAPPALVDAWKRSRGPVEDDGLGSTILPQQAKRLASAATYESPLKDLRTIAADPADAGKAAEAMRLIARVEAIAAERLAQATRLEASHPPTAIAAHQQVAKRFAGTPAAEEAKARLASKELKQQAVTWKQVSRMREIASTLKPVGKPHVDDKAFVKANGPRLQDLQAIGLAVLKDAAETAAGGEARAILDRYGIPVAARK